MAAALPLCGIGLKPKPHHGIVHFNGPKGAVISILPDECYECSFWDTCVIDGDRNQVHVLTNSPNSFQYLGTGSVLAEGKFDFGNLGEYNVSITDGHDVAVSVLQEPDNWIVLYLLAAVVVIFPLVIDRIIEISKEVFWNVAEVNREFLEDYNIHVDVNRQALPQHIHHDRVHFLDALRGYAIFLMIFVNYGGGGLPLMAHSAWYGLTVADIIFPLFLYCSGMAIFINHCQCPKSRLFTRNHAWKTHFCCARLIFLGIVLSNYAGDSVRVMGVLQRIGFTIYVFWILHCLLTMLLAKIQHISDDSSWWQQDPFSDCLEIGVIAICGLVYIVIYTLPIGDCPLFYQGPGGIADHGQYFNCTGGIARTIDVLLVHEEYLYRNPTNKELYHTVVPYDPEGILGSIAACMTLGFGYLSDFKWWFIGGLTSGLYVLGAGIHVLFEPICKNTWNFSFVFVNAGIHNSLLVYLYLLQYGENRQAWRFKTLCFIGRYSLLIYICHEVCVGRFPVQFDAGASTLLQMLNTSWGVFLHVMLAYLMNWGRFKITFDHTFGSQHYRPLLS